MGVNGWSEQVLCTLACSWKESSNSAHFIVFEIHMIDIIILVLMLLIYGSYPNELFWPHQACSWGIDWQESGKFCFSCRIRGWIPLGYRVRWFSWYKESVLDFRISHSLRNTRKLLGRWSHRARQDCLFTTKRTHQISCRGTNRKWQFLCELSRRTVLEFILVEHFKVLFTLGFFQKGWSVLFNFIHVVIVVSVFRERVLGVFVDGCQLNSCSRWKETYAGPRYREGGRLELAGLVQQCPLIDKEPLSCPFRSLLLWLSVP